MTGTLNLTVTIDNIPDPIGQTDGHVMTIDNDGWIVAAPAGGPSLPAVTSSDDGKVLKVGAQISGEWGVGTDNTGGGSGRELLTGNRTYYVRTDGSNSNDGLANTSGGAFLTLQKAYDVASTLDFGGFSVTIQVGAGTYNTTTTTNILAEKPWVGGGALIIRGDTSTPSNCILQTTTAAVVYVATTLPGSLLIEGFRITSSSGNGISHVGTGVLHFNAIDFAACSWHIFASGTGAQIFGDGNYSISGSATHHWRMQNGASLAFFAKTLTLTGTPAFSGGFAYVDLVGMIEAYSNTYTGSATGPRYSANLNGVIKTSGGTLPGNSAGSTATGGQYT